MPEKHVLIVEDSQDDAIMLSHVVKNLLEMKATIAHDGPSAIMEASQKVFDIVLLDMNIPKVRGDAVAATLRQMQEYKKVPIIAITAYDQTEVRRQSLYAGCNIYLTKPIDIDTLIEVVNLYLGRLKED